MLILDISLNIDKCDLFILYTNTVPVEKEEVIGRR